MPKSPTVVQIEHMFSALNKAGASNSFPEKGALSIKLNNFVEGKVDGERYKMVSDFLSIQQKEAVWWKNACLSYFQTYSRMPIPNGMDKPDHTLEYYQKLSFPFAPGIRPQW